MTRDPPLERGAIRAPDGPGLALELRPDFLARIDVHARRAEAEQARARLASGGNGAHGQARHGLRPDTGQSIPPGESRSWRATCFCFAF